MDPQETWRQLSACYGEEWGRSAELAEELLAWLGKGGFPPRITGNQVFDTLIVRETCQSVASWDCA